MQATASPVFPYAGPAIIVQPREEPGDGSIRTPIRVAVPAVSNEHMYLCIEVFTLADQKHPSKIVVPQRTRVARGLSSRNNDLRCLLFDQCTPTDHFDIEERRIYLQIDATDHQVQYKDVNIYMIALYREAPMIKRIIEQEQLNLCKLGFCLCIAVNGEFQRVSPWSFSRIIHEIRILHSSRSSPGNQSQSTASASTPEPTDHTE